MSRHERSQADAVSRTATRIEAALGQLRAIDDMRSALFGWAYFSLVDGQELPAPPG